MSDQTVTINGVKYDAHTGMRAASGPMQPSKIPTKEKRVATHAETVHAHTQRSTTLNRQFVTRSTPKKTIEKPALQIHPVALKASTLHRSSIAASQPKHQDVRRFASMHPTPQPIHHKKMMDIAPQPHPLVAKAHASSTQATAQKKVGTAPVRATSQQLKQHVISDSLKNAPSHHKNTKQVKQKSSSKFPRIMSVVSASAALLLLAGYFTYINMPNLSVRVAAAQAGINASYPGFRPDGYSLNGPIAYNSGQVSMKFASTASPKNFTITQSRSDWDSSAVNQNYAQAKWGNDVTTTVDHGLTIYSHDANAAWVNGGILYTISGNAPLSNDQINHIATSM